MTTKQTAWHVGMVSAFATLVALGSTACTIENPCPAATRPSEEEQRCVDGGEPSRPDAAWDPGGNTPPVDPGARDAAPSSSPDASLTPPSPAPIAEAGVAFAPVAPPTVPPMVPPVVPPTVPATQPWPNHLVPVCWAQETVARRDFATLAADFRAVAEQSWPRAANVRLQGFDACTNNPLGVLVLQLVDGVGLDVTEGYLGRSGEHRLTVGVARKDLLLGLVPHALAHALGLAEGPHGHDDCAGAPPSNTLEAKGECRPRMVLSFSDRVRARELYGALPAGELDPRHTSFDGDRAADVVVLESAGAGARVRVLLSNGQDFGAPFSGTWAELAAMPSGVHGGDYNGDGLTDLGLYDGPRGTFAVRLSTGTNFDGPQAELWHTEAPPNSKVVTGDYDGDGKTDLAFFTPTRQLGLVRSTDLGFAPLRDGLPGAEFGGTDGRHIAGDFDGDGRTDLAYLEPSQITEVTFPTTNTVWLAISEGTRFRPMGIIIPAEGFGSLKGEHYAADWDGDARDELAYYEPVDGVLWPAGYAPPNGTWRPERRFGTPALLSGRSLPLLADFDGDGISDVAYLDPESSAMRFMRAKDAGLEPPLGSTPLGTSTVRLIASSLDARGL